MPWWESSVFWGIAGIVVGIIVAAIFFIIGKKKTLFQYYKSTAPLITEKMAGILDGRMSIDGQPVKSLTSTTISFVNSGNQRIQSSDFSTQEPLRVILEGQLYGYDVSLGNQKLLPKVELVEEKVLNISFENLKPGQVFRVTLLHDETLDVLGELTTGTMRKFRSRFSRALPFMVAAVLIAVILLFVIILDSAFNNGHTVNTVFMSVYGCAIVVVCMLIMFILLIVSSVFLEKELFLYNGDINNSVEKDLNFLKTLARILGLNG